MAGIDVELTTENAFVFENNTMELATSWKRDPYQVYQLAFQCILFILIVVGNAVVIIAITKKQRHGRSSNMEFMIKNLAFGDLSTGLCDVLTDIIEASSFEWAAGLVMCRIVRYLEVVVVTAATYLIVALSIDRLDAIARPMNFVHRRLRAKLLVAGAWLSAALLGINRLVSSRVVSRLGRLYCRIWTDSWERQAILIFLAIFFIPALILCICCCSIIYILRKKSTQSTLINAAASRPSSNPLIARAETDKNQAGTSSGAQSMQISNTSHRMDENAKQVYYKAKLKTIRITLLIVLAFILCWAPYSTMMLLDTFLFTEEMKHDDKVRTVRIFFESLYPLNSLANPIIYGLCMMKICRKQHPARSGA